MILGRHAREYDGRATILPAVLATRDAEVGALRREVRRLREELHEAKARLALIAIELPEV